jgi:hypothetical protein
MFEKAGRKHWRFIFYKLAVFFLASLGIITEDVLSEICKRTKELQIETEDDYTGKPEIQKYSYIEKVTY